MFSNLEGRGWGGREVGGGGKAGKLGGLRIGVLWGLLIDKGGGGAQRE